MSPSLGTFFLFDHLKINWYIQEIIYLYIDIILLHDMTCVKYRMKIPTQRLPPINTDRRAPGKEEIKTVPPNRCPGWAFFWELTLKSKLLLPKYAVPTRRSDGVHAIFVAIQFSTHILLVKTKGAL